MKKISKKILALLAIATMSSSMISTSHADSFPFLTVNGKRVSTTPVIRNGRTLVPIRVIGEELGSQVDYNSATREVTVVKPGINIKLKIDKNNPTVNGVTKSIDVPATIINSRTYVPVRFVSESFGINVDYNQQNNEVIVGKPATSPLPSINQTLTFEVWEDRMDLKFGDNWDDRLENSLKIKYGEYNLNIKYGNDWDDRLEYALYQHYQGKIPTSMPTDIPPTLTPVQPTTPVVPPTSNTGKLSFSQWEDRMELRFGDDWNDMIEDAIEYKYGEWHMEYYYGDDWDDRLEYALYQHYQGKIPTSMPTDIPPTLTPVQPTTPVVPPTSNTGKLSFSQWEDRMELRFGDDWNDMIEDAIEYKYGEWHMEYYYGDDWDDRLEYALYLYYNGQIPNSLIKDIPNTLKPIR